MKKGDYEKTGGAEAPKEKTSNAPQASHLTGILNYIAGARGSLPAKLSAGTITSDQAAKAETIGVDFVNWHNGLSWYAKNSDAATLTEAKSRQASFNSAIGVSGGGAAATKPKAPAGGGKPAPKPTVEVTPPTTEMKKGFMGLPVTGTQAAAGLGALGLVAIVAATMTTKKKTTAHAK